MTRCIACNGSGYYDHDGSPPCGACNGTGEEQENVMPPVNPFVRADEMLDFTGPDLVEVTVTPEGDRVWVNVNGQCVLRCCQVKELKVQDGAMTSYYNQAGKIAEFKYED